MAPDPFALRSSHLDKAHLNNPAVQILHGSYTWLCCVLLCCPVAHSLGSTSVRTGPQLSPVEVSEARRRKRRRAWRWAPPGRTGWLETFPSIWVNVNYWHGEPRPGLWDLIQQATGGRGLVSGWRSRRWEGRPIHTCSI